MTSSSKQIRVAIAASGLSHIPRGIESWASDLGRALRDRGIDALTFQGSGESCAGTETLSCWKRTDRRTLKLVKLLKRLGAWRVHLGSAYELEQFTFAFHLWLRIRKSFDILHVQDPIVALRLNQLNRVGLSRARVIYAHGTEEEPEFLRRFSNLQHLAPPYLESWETNRPLGQAVYAIPNPVDIDRFAPPEDDNAKAIARNVFGLRQDALIILCVAALKVTHKRLDYLIREFSSFQRCYAGVTQLLIVGAREPETPNVLEVADSVGTRDVRIMEGVAREHVVTLLKCADIFTLSSLHEMFSIALLEALASGLPIACNRNAVFEYAVGLAGRPRDISESGGLASQFGELGDPLTRIQLGRAARQRAETVFSTGTVVDQTLAMYEDVLRRK